MNWIDNLFAKYWVSLTVLLIGLFIIINNVFNNTTISILGSCILTALVLHVKHRYVLYSVLTIVWVLTLISIF